MKASFRKTPHLMILARWGWWALILAPLVQGCSRGSTPSTQPPRTEAGPAETAVSPGAEVGPADATGGEAEVQDRWTGIRGRIEALEGSAAGSVVLVAIPDSQAPARRVEADGEGTFKVSSLDPGTYRLILPADGVHATAEQYVTVATEGDQPEVLIPRSKGCPVKITVRDQDQSLISGAELELELPDLPQVSQRHRVRGTTNTQGLLVLTSSCVRGFFEGRVVVPDRGAFAVHHGYVGTGYDQFDIVLPESPDGSVSYANDD